MADKYIGVLLPCAPHGDDTPWILVGSFPTTTGIFNRIAEYAVEHGMTRDEAKPNLFHDSREEITYIGWWTTVEGVRSKADLWERTGYPFRAAVLLDDLDHALI